MKERDNIVIVIDNSNYKESYAEKCPFKAVITDRWKDNQIVVRSLETGKEYELYYYQILEFLSMEEIADILTNGYKK